MSDKSRFYYLHEDQRGDYYHSESGCSDTTGDVCDGECDCQCHERYDTLSQAENFIAGELKMPRRR